MREELEQLICTSGLRAVSFDSAADYLAFSEPEHAACLILDVLLPDIDGLDLYQRIANDCAPVVFVTRQAEVASSVRALKCGAIDFLLFPCGREELLRAVHAAFDRNRSLRIERGRIAELQLRLARLTPRERQVLALVVSGLQNKQVAVALGISPITVQIHRGSLMRKMATRSLANLVRIADTLQLAHLEKTS
jgi:FixJ family two-component response regulator